MPRRKAVPVCGDMGKFAELIELMPDDRRRIAGSLAQELVFMAKTLDRLRSEVAGGDVVNRETNKESAALKSYNTTIMRYSSSGKYHFK